jgi:folate-binding protein YgfZ
MGTDDVTAEHATEAAIYALGPDAVTAETERVVFDGAAMGAADVGVLDVTGPGVVPCLQGLLTNDLEAPGPQGFLYGAVLTPKGMIVCDMWAARRRESVTLYPPAGGVERLLELFKRTLPPRLAKVANVSAERAVLRLVGPAAVEVARRAGIVIPEPGQAATAELDGVRYGVGRPRNSRPFALQLDCDHADADTVRGALGGAGATPADHTALELARILSGWPRLDVEIDKKTLPQEVRYDDIGGVSYSKGCYTGQETVARLHFRGHANRHLRGLVWKDGPPDLTDPTVVRGEKAVGRVTSVAWIPGVRCYVGLGVVRREVSQGESVTAAGATATIADPPIALSA